MSASHQRLDAGDQRSMCGPDAPGGMSSRRSGTRRPRPSRCRQRAPAGKAPARPLSVPSCGNGRGPRDAAQSANFQDGRDLDRVGDARVEPDDGLRSGLARVRTLLRARPRLKRMGQHKYQSDGRPGSSGPGFAVTHEQTLTEALRWRSPRAVFVNSMSDLFHEETCRVHRARVRDHR